MTTPNDGKDVDELAAELVDELSGHADLSADDVADQIQSVMDQFGGLPAEEAQRSVRNNIIKANDIDKEELGEGNGEPEKNQHILVNEINQDEQWVDVTVKVDQLWEPNSDTVAQVGLVGDESGRCKFIAFESSNVPELDEGQSYELTNVVTDEYEGDYSIKLNKTTGINPIDEDIEVGDNSETIAGPIVDIQSGSGLIKRCPEDGCSRVLKNDYCKEHGEVDGEDDLRIKGVLDDGTTVQTVIFNREMTEELTGVSLDDAVQMARDAMDREKVEREMRKDVIGRYYKLTGTMLGDNFLVDEFEFEPNVTDAEAVLVKARSI